MSVDAASTGCCCTPPAPLNCNALWQCSTMSRFRLNYDLGITLRTTGTSAAGQQVWSEIVATLVGHATFKKTSSAPVSSDLMYTMDGSSTWNLFYRTRLRQFFTGVSCQPCGSTYLQQEQTFTATGTSNTALQWSFLSGRCNSCGCGDLASRPRYLTFIIGGAGTYTRTSQVNSQTQTGTPIQTNGGCFFVTSVCPPDGCVTPSWFADCNWNTCPVPAISPPQSHGALTTTSGQVLLTLPEPNVGSGIIVPTRCGPIDPCTSNTSSDFSASGGANIYGDTHVCQTGAGFVCGCDAQYTNGCLPTLDTYEKFGTFTATPL